jgi:hypothetical protein
MNESPDRTPDAPGAVPPRRRMARALWVLPALVAVGGLAVLAFFGLRWTGVLKAPIPTPACVEPSLTLGTLRFRIESIARAADGSLAAAPSNPGVAYWVEGTVINYVFALSPSAENLALRDTLKVGDEATITWADCMTDTYQVESVESSVPDLASLTAQSSGGLTAYAGEPGGSGLLITAARPRVEAPETPEPTEEGAVQADMAFGETTVSADGSTITMGVTITNTGSIAFSLTTADLSLTPEGGQEQAPLSVEPALLQEIAPGAGVTLRITFAHPGTKVAVLRILDIMVEQYF